MIQGGLHVSALSLLPSKEPLFILSLLSMLHADYFKNKAAIMLNKGEGEAHVCFCRNNMSLARRNCLLMCHVNSFHVQAHRHNYVQPEETKFRVKGF